MLKKIIFVGDGNSIHFKKWIPFFCEDFNIILISDTSLYDESIQFWEKNKVKYYDFNIKGNTFLKGLNLFKKIISYNYIILKNKNNSVINWHYISLNIILSLPSSLFIKKRISTLWGSDFNLSSGIKKNNLKIAFKISNFITSDTKEILDKVNNLYNISKNKLFYINHGVDSNIFNNKKTINIKNNLTIFSPRGFNSFYNHHILFENIELLISKLGKDIKLIFIDYNSDSDYKERFSKYQKQYINNLILLNSLSQEELAEQYKKSDIVISIPKDDGFPVTLIESLFSLKPTIGINKKDYLEVLPKELIINEYIITEVISKIKFCIENKKQITDQLIKIKEKYFYKFDYEENMKKMKQLYLK